MVDVPVDNGDAVDPARSSPLGNERLVSEEAEPVRLGGLRMVTGWPHERVGDSRAAVDHRVGRLEQVPAAARERPTTRRRAWSS